MIIGVLLASFFCLLFFVYRSIKETGRQEAKIETQENIIEDMYLGKIARDNLRKSHNNDAANELRERFTRD